MLIKALDKGISGRNLDLAFCEQIHLEYFVKFSISV